MRTNAIFVAILGVLLATSAFGQDGTEVTMARSPLNAQKFLAQNLPTRIDVLGSPPDYADFFKNEGSVLSSDVCVTDLHVKLIESTGAKPHHVSTHQIEQTLTIHWDNISGVYPGGSYIVLEYKPNKIYKQVSFVYEDISLRDRVLSASQYLQKACDHSENLGF